MPECFLIPKQSNKNEIITEKVTIFSIKIWFTILDKMLNIIEKDLLCKNGNQWISNLKPKLPLVTIDILLLSSIVNFQKSFILCILKLKMW